MDGYAERKPTHQLSQDGHHERGDGGVAGHLGGERQDVAEDEQHEPGVETTEHRQPLPHPPRQARLLQR